MLYDEMAKAIDEEIRPHSLGEGFQITTREGHSIVWGRSGFYSGSGNVEIWWKGDEEPTGWVSCLEVMNRILSERS